MPITLFHAPEALPAERSRDLPRQPEAGTKDFRRLLERTLPPEAAAELTEEFDPAARRISRLRIALAALLTAMIALLAWFFFPRIFPEPVRTLGGRELHRTPPGYFSPLRSVYDQALESYENRHYAACAGQLLPHLKELTAAPPGENAALLLLFFDAVRVGHLPPEMRSAACDAAAELVRIEPDDPRWRICDLELNHHVRLDCEALLRAIKNGAYRYSDPEVLKRPIRRALASVQEARRHADPNDAQLQTLLDYAEARLLVSQWMAEGNGTENFPNSDPDTPGVISREKALALIRRHSRVAEFRALRRFIASTVFRQVGLLDFYWWEGERYFSTDPLKEILTEADDE